MDKFIDVQGLGHFKARQDEVNAERFVTLISLDDILDGKLTNIYTYRGSVDSVSELPTQGNNVGDVYDVAEGMNYAWNGTRWDELGDKLITIDAALSADSTNPVQNRVIKEALDAKANNIVFGRNDDGLVPHPKTNGTTHYLREDGEWEVPPDTQYKIATDSDIDSLFS